MHPTSTGRKIAQFTRSPHKLTTTKQALKLSQPGDSANQGTISSQEVMGHPVTQLGGR
jgi:hypothetical protein